MATKKEARDIVSNIAKKYGYISESDWTKLGHLDPGLRKTFEEAMRNMQKIAARTITRYIIDPRRQRERHYSLSLC